jgi:hypothetical protein
MLSYIRKWAGEVKFLPVSEFDRSADDWIEEVCRDQFHVGDFMIDDGYEYIDYNETYWGALEFLSQLKKTGVELSEQSLMMWNDWIEERKSDMQYDCDMELLGLSTVDQLLDRPDLLKDIYGDNYNNPYAAYSEHKPS